MLLKNWLKALVFSALALAAATLPAQNAMTLDDCVNYALTNNPQIKVAQLAVADADWRIKENTATGLPQVSAGATYTGFLQRGGLPSSALSFGGGGGSPLPADLQQALSNASLSDLPGWIFSQFQSDPDSKIFFSPVHSVAGTISANQLIFNNSYLLALKAARFYRLYANDQLNVARQTVRHQVTDAYLPALLISESLGTLDLNISNLEKLLAETREVNKAGFVEQLDVDRLELSLATLRSERGSLARQQEMVVNALKMTMGMAVSEQINLSDNVDKLLAASGDADLTSPVNFQNRPEYVQLLRGRELGGIQVDLYRKPWLPTVAGFVQYQANYQGGFGAKDADGFNKWYLIPSAVAGISVSVPIYNGGGSKASRQRALITVQTIEAQRAMLENAINLEVENARKQYLNAQERVQNQVKNLDLAKRIYDTTQTKYKAGVGSSFELVSAEQGLYAAQQAVMQARFDLLTAKVAVKKALGGQ